MSWTKICNVIIDLDDMQKCNVLDLTDEIKLVCISLSASLRLLDYIKHKIKI